MSWHAHSTLSHGGLSLAPCFDPLDDKRHPGLMFCHVTPSNKLFWHNVTQKAFQNISPSKILFAKLEYYGVCGIALEWFRSYLYNKSQIVMYRDTDLPTVLRHSQCIIFADDTTVYISGMNEPVLRQLIEYDLASHIRVGSMLTNCL